MEVYILDSLYRRIAVVDHFHSMIWTERARAWGDFDFRVHSTLENRNRFLPGVRLSINLSYRVMTVETIEDATDDEGRRILTVKGRSLEAILESRVAMAALTDLTTDPKWTIEDVPKAVAEKIFHDICITGTLDAGDIIPATEDTIFPADTIDAPTDEIIYSFEPKSVYEALVQLSDAFAMGFRFTLDPAVSILYFDVYMGRDRTSFQTTDAAVIFSPNLDNLKDTKQLTTDALYKNVAYVLSPVGHEIVFALDVDPLVEGFERKVLYVSATDITDPDGPTASAQMIQRGTEELAKYRRFIGFDGELALTTQYRYGVDYNLNDLVEIRNDEGTSSIMQITEQIFVSDDEGERSYPTLVVNAVNTPGSWSSYHDEEWDEMTTEHWDELP